MDGDKHDLRFLDKTCKQGFVIGLIAKGKARFDVSGFVVVTKKRRAEIKRKNEVKARKKMLKIW